MRQTTQRLLLLLYSQNLDRPFRLKLESLDFILPELTRAGRRSLVYLLKRQHLIEWIKLDGVDWLSITAKGQEMLIQVFPVLNPFWDRWQGEWSEIVFLQAPAGDKQFRYLRSVLMAERAMSLSRGVYLQPSGLSAKIESLLKQLYASSVLVTNFTKTEIGSLRPIVVEYYMLNELYNNYSGIGNQLTELLDGLETKKGLIEADTPQLLKLMEKIQFNLNSDLGLLQFYFPDATRADDLIKQLQFIINYLYLPK